MTHLESDRSLDRLERVFLRRIDHLYSFLRSRVRNHYLAEDLVQQVFLRAHQGIGSFRGDDEVMVSWLFQIARNESATALGRVRYHASWEDLVAGGLDPPDEEHSPEQLALRAEQRREVDRLLAHLTTQQVELLHLRYAAGLTAVQIASVLHITDVAARQRLHRALRQLKGIIDDRG